MHTDLTQFCERCALRLSTQLKQCPRCDGVLIRAVSGTTPKARWLGKADAVRVILIEGAALIVYLLSVVGAVHLVFFQTGTAGLNFWVIMPGLLGGFLGVGIALGLIWAPWAALVSLVFYLLPGKASVPLWVVGARLQDTGSRLPRWLERLGGWTDKRTWRSWLMPPLLLLTMQLVFQLVTAPAWFVTAAPDHVLKVSIAICVGTFLVWLLLSPGLVIAGTLLLRLLLDVEGAYASLRLLRPVTLSELLQDRQGHAPLVGRAVPAAVSTAPLSGTPCVGFRLVGVVDGVQLDDAWIGSFAIEHDDSTPARAVPGAARLVLPVVEPASIALDAEQSTRLCQLLSERGLPTQLQQVWLAEAVLAPNAEVRVWGAQSEEAADASAGYRQRAVRTLVSGTDAVPMLIAPS